MKKSLMLAILLVYSCSKDDNSGSGTKFNHVIAENTNTHEITIGQNKRVASLKMSYDEYDSYIQNDQFYKDNNFTQDLIQDIYKKFEDDYDYVLLVLNEDEKPPEVPYGVNRGVKNDNQGTGIDVFDYSVNYGSQGTLKNVIQLYYLNGLTNGPALHELMHNWANKAIPTTLSSHWGFTGGSNKGQLGGFDQNTLVSNGGNSYSVGSFGEFANGGNSVPYTEFELYLMGMIPLTDVNPFDTFEGITLQEYSDDYKTMTFNAEIRTSYSPSSIESLLGKRIPSYQDSQKEFMMLMIVLTTSDLTEEQWMIADESARIFSKNEAASRPYNFWEATKGIGSIIIGDF